jgi:TrmH family RNA methyltransferase
MIPIIESPQNSIFKKYLSLSTSKGIKKEGLFLLSGEKLIAEFLKNPHLQIEAELLHSGLDAVTDLKPTLFSKDLFRQLDTLGTHFNLLAIKTPHFETEDFKAPAQGLEIVCPLGDPGNLGALARSALAFGASKLILTEESAHPFLPKALKSSAGALLKLPLSKSKKISDLPQDMIALDPQGESLENFKWPKNCRLFIGEEGPGIGELKFKNLLSIPTQQVESLNAVVAASIALFDYRAKCHH